MHKYMLYGLVLLLVFSLVACKDDKAAQKPAAVGQAEAPVAAQPEVQQEEPKVEKEVYNYDPQGRRDPFLSLIQEAKEKPRKKGATPVENFDVSEIRLIAIAWDNQQYYAMITLPDNKSYTVRKGVVLGLHGGRVESITKDSMVIREEVKDYRGQIKPRDTILKLRKEEDE